MSSLPLLDVQNISKSFGAHELFYDISFSIADGQKVGLIAQNGTGKSTLLSLLTGNDTPDSGKIIYRNDVKVGYLEQAPVFDKSETVLDACFHSKKDADALQKAKQVLTQLDITDLEQPMGQLSGGQQKRVALASILVTSPDLFILDEPTNHLDLQMTEWLEGYLKYGHKTLLLVTHDRYFLDHVCDTIIELDNKTLYTYKGNYAYYLEKRQSRIDNTRAEIARANNLYRKELEWMRRMPQARGHKAKYREDAFVELQQQAHQRIEERQLRLKNSNVYIGSKIFECQYVSKCFGNKIILNNFYYNFARYEKMGIVGHNGSGKSTFVKMLLGLVKPDSGSFDIGSTVKFGYFAQEGLQFSPGEKVIDAVTDIADYIEIGHGKTLTASQLLQHFLFTPQQQHDYIEKLSGGEKRKLYLCTVLMKNPNFLVLDEPTNDLDIQTLQVLEDYLADFPGCVIIVSHDRYFMDKVVDHLLIFKGNGVIQDFPGNYTQYREWEKLKSNDQQKATDKAGNKAKESYHHNVKRKMTYKEKNEFESLTTELQKLDEEQKMLVSQLSSGKLGVDDITTKAKRLDEIKHLLDDKEMRWLELSELQ